MPVILEIGLKDVVLLVHLERGLFLGEGVDISQEHVGKRISGRNRTTSSELQEAVHAIAGLRDFVLVGVHNVDSKLQIMRADALADIVAERESRIGVQRTVGNISRIFGKVILAACQTNAGHLAAKTVVIDSDRGKSRQDAAKAQSNSW